MDAIGASELIITNGNRVYHLDMSPDELADKVILVGDPDRVTLVSQFFDSIEYTAQHREFVKTTGTYESKRITVMSTGIGTGNIDIVMNELDALVNIDLSSRTVSSTLKSLDIVRIGTCGLLQANLPIHAFVMSVFACGFDNTADFYKIDYNSAEEELNQAFNTHVDMPSTIQTYTAAASAAMVAKLDAPQVYKGITATSCGFYGPQGRQLRLKAKCSKMTDQIASFRTESNGETLQVLNFEMESSMLFALGNTLGHRCGSICLGIADRTAKEFSDDPTPHMEALIKHVLDRL